MTKQKLQLVSVIVRTHNRAALLSNALSCLVNQTYHPIEIIVIDHNSTDDTQKVVASFGKTIKYYKHYGSFRDTFNVWRNKVNGELISVLDDDDYIAPDCIEKLTSFLNMRKDIDIVFSRHKYFNINNGINFLDESPNINNKLIKKLLLMKDIIPWNSVLFRRKCLDNINEIDKSITGAFDWFFWIQLSVAGYKFYQLNEILGFIQRSNDSVQFEFERMSKGMLDCVQYYGNNLTFKKKIFWGYYYTYGYRLICHGINCLEIGEIKVGRIFLLKGIFNYCVAFKNRLKLIPAILILYSSFISDPKMARIRNEKLFRNYLFRTYTQRNDNKYKRINPSSFWKV